MSLLFRAKNYLYRRLGRGFVRRWFFVDMIHTTSNFDNVRWLGHPIWQNILDLWVIQEVISEIRPALLIECGTNRGGSALFYAHLFELLGEGRVLTMDIRRQHDVSHSRITFFEGDSTSESTLAHVRALVRESKGPVMVILDSDHSAEHVFRELETYAPFVTKNSYCLVQDGVIDQLEMFSKWRPGPLSAIRKFLSARTDFVVDSHRCSRFPITHHPMGWLKRIA